MAQNQAALTIVNNGNQMATQKQAPLPSIVEKVFIGGDLAELTVKERWDYFLSVCTALEVNPIMRPFDYIKLDGKLTLYANANCAQQLRGKYGVSLSPPKRETFENVLITTIEHRIGARTDTGVGAVPFAKENGAFEKYEYWKDGKKLEGKKFVPDGTFTPLSLSDRANAIMKCDTKAKRRGTFSITGFGIFLQREDQIDEVERADGIEIVDTAKDFNAELDEGLALLEASTGPGPKPEGVSDATYENYTAVFTEAQAAGIDIEEYRLTSDMTVSMIVAQGKYLRNAITQKKKLIPEGETAQSLLSIGVE